MVSRPPRVRRLGTLKPQGYKFEFINEGIDGTHRIVFGDPVIQSLREEHRLVSTLAFDKSLHGAFPRMPRRSSYPSIALRFHTTSVGSSRPPNHFVRPMSRHFGPTPGVTARLR